jgi:glycosyltransferase involved in cell wall biosynthesis
MATLRKALDRDELAAFIKPYLLRFALTEYADVVFIDSECWVERLDFLTPMSAALELQIFASLPASLAASKPSLQHAIELGLGDPTSRLIRVANGAEITGILDAWTEWINDSYARLPAANLASAETEFLRVQPATRASAAWDHQDRFAQWFDLQADMPFPSVVGLQGLRDHLATREASVLADRRSDSRQVIEQLTLRWQPPGAPASVDDSGPATYATRKILRATDPFGLKWVDPGAGDYLLWLETLDSRGLSRYAQDVYWSRPDIQRDFPSGATSVAVFMDWMRAADMTPAFVARAETEKPANRSLPDKMRGRLARIVNPPATLASSRHRPTDLMPGVNVVGFATAESGLGAAARTTLNALAALEMPTAIVDASGLIQSRITTPLIPVRGTPYDVTIFHVNPEEMLGYSDQLLAYRFAACWNIGVWFWETDRIPDRWTKALDFIDELWVASSYTKVNFEKVTGKPIHVLPLPVDMGIPRSVDRSTFGIEEGAFALLTIADAFSGYTRKNPNLVVEAFRSALPHIGRPARLVLKINNLDKFPGLEAELQALIRDLPVTILTDHMDSATLRDLIACADAYISLHSSEGYGLTMLEAMSEGVPVIATRHGGNLDFMNASNSLLVDYRLVGARGGRYAGEGRWAEPDTEQAARQVVNLARDPALRGRLVAAANQTAIEHGTERHIGQIRHLLGGLFKGSNEALPSGR